MIFFYHKWFVYISIAHTIHTSLLFFITLFKFYKNVCKKMCTNYDLFFLLVDRGYMGGGRKKKKGNKKEKRNGEWNLRVWWEKRRSGKERRKKNLKGKKLNWFYLYVHFVWCKV